MEREGWGERMAAWDAPADSAGIVRATDPRLRAPPPTIAAHLADG